MRLLQCDQRGNFSFAPTSDQLTRPYAILSHTWGSDEDEVAYQDLGGPTSDWQSKAGHMKLKFCARQAKRHGLQYFWIDTCCIDKSSSNELQAAITGMFRWYREAERCYVYLADVSSPNDSNRLDDTMAWKDEFEQSKWFTRGWTLQELIAPEKVEFFSKEGGFLGDKQSLEHMICQITRVPARALRGTPLSNFTVQERKAWAHDRRTKLPEDKAYSLLGIFDVGMSIRYNEGQEEAWRRLSRKIEKSIKGSHMDEFSVTFSLAGVPKTQHFVGREGELAQMHRHLLSDGRRRAVTLQGLGGIGKTQLSVAYIDRYRYEYTAIFWVNYKDETSIRQSFTKMRGQILEQHKDAGRLQTVDLESNPDEVVKAVKAWLSLPNNTRWLIVYDNHDDPSLIDMERFLPEADHGSIIVTTRLFPVQQGHRIQMQKLRPMEDGLRILSSTSDQRDFYNDSDAQELAKELDGLPLALAVAAAYLERVCISPRKYLDLYKEKWASFQPNTSALDSYQDRTLSSTWQLSYEQVQKQNPVAAHLLQWWAYFNNEDIWFELLQDFAQHDPSDLKQLADQQTFLEAIGTLRDYGLVYPHKSGSNVMESNRIESEGYSIHACLHAWSLHVLNRNHDGRLEKLALEYIAGHVPSPDQPTFWLLQRRLLPHAALMSCAKFQGNDEDLGLAFHNLGMLFDYQHKLQESQNMYERALQLQEEKLGADHLSTLDTAKRLGNLYSAKGKSQEAEEMYQRALQGYQKVLEPDDPSVLHVVGNLGNLYYNKGNFEEAEEMYQRALQGYRKVLEPNNLPALHTVGNLANLYNDKGNFKEAEEMYQRALQGYQKVLEPDNPSVLNVVNNLGVLHGDNGNFKEAEEMYQRALQGYQKVFEPDDPSVLDVVSNLGALYSDNGNFKEAEEMYQRALQGYQKVYEPDNPSVLRVTANLGALYHKQGKFQEAEEMYQRALRAYEKSSWQGDMSKHVPAIRSMWNLGKLSQRQGHLSQAREYCQRAFTDLESLYGSSHPLVESWRSGMLDLDRVIQADSIQRDEPTVEPTLTQDEKRKCRMFRRILGCCSK